MIDLEKIRQSCELFAAVYPLSPEIWLRWLKTELTVASSEAEVQRVFELFQRALADYFSFEVAFEMVQLAEKSPTLEPQIWDLLLSTYSLHCSKGKQLFDVWRKQFLKKPE
jgi:squamous cell carcinoma antigen recognized by T-cells 3